MVAVVVVLDVCFCKNKLVELVVKSEAVQFHPFAAAIGSENVQAAADKAPTLIVNDDGPLLVAILAPDPPHPFVAIFGGKGVMSW